MPPDPAKPHVAVCPGSYDPITKGHIDIITRAAEIFDELIVSVVNASVRKDRALFTAEERVGFIEQATRHLTNVRVDTFDVLVVDYARRVGATSEVADIIFFLCSTQASYVTGSEIHINGGQHV